MYIGLTSYIELTCNPGWYVTFNLYLKNKIRLHPKPDPAGGGRRGRVQG